MNLSSAITLEQTATASTNELLRLFNAEAEQILALLAQIDLECAREKQSLVTF